jgi:transposase-like protein
VRTDVDIHPNCPTEWEAIKAVARKLGIGAAETVWAWVRKTKGGSAAMFVQQPVGPRVHAGSGVERRESTDCVTPTDSRGPCDLGEVSNREA